MSLQHDIPKTKYFHPKRRNLMMVGRHEGLYGVYYEVNNERFGEAEIVDTNDYYG